MDGTLVRSDLLWESFLHTLTVEPLSAASALLWIGEGKAALKRRLSAAGGTRIVVENLPFDANVLAYLRERRAAGCRIELVSAADQVLVDRVLAHLGIFDAGFGSNGSRNLTGSVKAEFLRNRYSQGFAYIGNSRADLASWEAAKEVLTANAPPAVVRRLRERGMAFEEISQRLPVWRAALKAMRLHQWGKNVLLFTIFVLTLSNRSIFDFLLVVGAFLAFGMVASATYLFNDLIDIEADRIHPSKRRRPIASGALPINVACALIFLLLFCGFAVGFAVGPAFAGYLAAYTVLTASYSLVLKSIAIVDVLTIGILFCMRILAGAAAVGVPVGKWLAVFSLLFFSSLAFAKRCAEMQRKTGSDSQILAGRGYLSRDVTFVFGFGAALAVASLLVFMLHAFSGDSAALSNISTAMVCLGVMSYWIMRVWLLTLRGEMDDDPVVFAIHDLASYGLAGIIFTALVLDQWLR